MTAITQSGRGVCCRPGDGRRGTDEARASPQATFTRLYQCGCGGQPGRGDDDERRRWSGHQSTGRSHQRYRYETVSFQGSRASWKVLELRFFKFSGTWNTQHTHPFNGPSSGTTRVSRYQKSKTNLGFTEARDSEWQWHQLGHTQVCTSLQTDNHASTPPLSFYRPDALSAAQPTASKH